MKVSKKTFFINGLIPVQCRSLSMEWKRNWLSSVYVDKHTSFYWHRHPKLELFGNKNDLSLYSDRRKLSGFFSLSSIKPLQDFIGQHVGSKNNHIHDSPWIVVVKEYGQKIVLCVSLHILYLPHIWSNEMHQRILFQGKKNFPPCYEIWCFLV